MSEATFNLLIKILEIGGPPIFILITGGYWLNRKIRAEISSAKVLDRYKETETAQLEYSLVNNKLVDLGNLQQMLIEANQKNTQEKLELYEGISSLKQELITERALVLELKYKVKELDNLRDQLKSAQLQITELRKELKAANTRIKELEQNNEEKSKKS